MKLLHFFLLCLFASLFPLTAVANDLPTYNQMVIFGDSLSDNGNIYRATLGLIPKSPPYAEGRFTNGKAWSDLAAEYFSNKSETPTVNYAVGGETVNFHNPFDGFLPYTFSNSLISYYLRTAFQDRSHTLFIIWLGANDYLNGADDLEKASTDVINTIQKNIESLIDAGGMNFLVVNLPDLAALPRSLARDDKEALHTLTLLHNKKLQMILEDAQNHHPKIAIRMFDIYKVFTDMENDLPAYNQKYHTHIEDIKTACWDGGYTKKSMALTEDEIRHELQMEYQKKTAMRFSEDNKKSLNFSALAHYIAITPSLMESYRVSKSYANGQTICEQPDDHAFWDQVHPAAPVHRIISELMIEQINYFNHRQ